MPIHNLSVLIHNSTRWIHYFSVLTHNTEKIEGYVFAAKYLLISFHRHYIMKKLVLIALLAVSTPKGYTQTVEDIFNPNDIKVSWLGIDFSHVKLIGDFSQFFGAGLKSTNQIKDEYFVGWNTIIMNEPKKYDIKSMLRKGDIFYDVDMIMGLNAKAPLETIESYNTPKYTKENIKGFVDAYNLESKEGLGVLFIAECLNKNAAEGIFHFLIINMKTKEILVEKRMSSVPSGFGLRNYWAASIYKIIKDIKDNQYPTWKKIYKTQSLIF